MRRHARSLSAVVAVAALATIGVLAGQTSAGAATGRTNLTLSLSGAPHMVAPGQTVTYTASVRNNGPETATGVRVRDWPPAKASLGSVSTSQGTCTEARPVVCQLGTLAPGASATVTVTVTADKGGWMVDQARAFADQRDPHPFNNIRVARTFVRAADRADVGVKIAASPRPVQVGQNLTYTLTINNTGPAVATNVIARNWLPARTTLSSATSTQGTCTQAHPVVCSLGNLAQGQTATVTVITTVNQPGVLRDEARVHSHLPDLHPYNNVRFAFVHATP